MFSILGGFCSSAEHIPTELIHHVAEWDEGEFIESHAHQEVDIGIYCGRNVGGTIIPNMGNYIIEHEFVKLSIK